MVETVVSKRRSGAEVAPNLTDLAAARASFSWDAAWRALWGLPGGGLNMAYECLERQARGQDGRRTALRLVDAQHRVRDVSYAALLEMARRFANVLAGLGVQPGDRVCVLLDRGLALFVATLGALRHRAVLCPLFPGFGPEPLRVRLEAANARVVVTTGALYERRLAPALEGANVQPTVLQTDGASPGTYDLNDLLGRVSADHVVGLTDPDGVALLHFTSGTTGAPKGAVHTHEALVAQHASARLVLDLRPGDVYWCTADPGWVTGTVYGVLAPLSVGVTLLVDAEPFDPQRWYRNLAGQGVDVWYTTPTALRMLMRAGPPAGEMSFARLRLAASVGEPLDPQTVLWGRDTLGVPIHDTWWQTETGSIMIANFRVMDIRPGAMGKPVPGIQAAVVRPSENGRLVPVDDPAATGELALRPPWPSLFKGYLGQEDRYRACFADGWYLTGDLARRDAEGYFWFVGRKDDVIKSAGHLIGPFEVEAVLLSHPAVADAAAVGVPDPVAGQQVKAYVVPKPGQAPDEALRRSVLAHARRRLGAAVAPRSIEFRESIPRTFSGKTLRRELRDAEGEPHE